MKHPMLPDHTIMQRLSELSSETLLSTAEIAALCSVDTQTVSRWHTVGRTRHGPPLRYVHTGNHDRSGTRRFSRVRWLATFIEA